MNLLQVDTLSEVKAKLDQYFAGLDRLEEEIPLHECLGRYLSQDINAQMNIPEFDRSVVDGYAILARDTFGVGEASPAMLRMIGEVEMGKAPVQVVKSGCAVYVPTGGMLPAGADAVVMIEYVERMDNENIAVYSSTAPNGNIMKKGDDFKLGQNIYKKGHRITTKDIGMLAAMGEAFVSVFVKPTVAIISTGDEVVSVMEEPAPGQIRDVNAHALSSLVANMGAKVGLVALVKDSEEELKNTVREALYRNNIVLLSGGSSAGTKDYTAGIIDSLGSPGVITHGVAMKPGKPTIIGVIKNENCCCHDRSSLVVGLPGHPMAAIISFKTIVEYFIRKYYFAQEEEELTIPARVTESIRGGEGRETFTFVKLIKEGKEWCAEPIHAKSGSISQLRYADGYIRTDAMSEGVDKDQMVEVVISW